MTAVIIVSGPPASGKSTLATYLSQRLQLPLLSKDLIKEDLFDSVGHGNRTISTELGRESFKSLIRQCKERVQQSQEFILESAFRAQDGKLLNEIFASYRILHVSCMASNSLLIKRFSLRAKSGERHRGHVDEENIDKLLVMLEENVFELFIPNGTRIVVSSNDFQSEQYNADRVKILEEFWRPRRK